MSTTSTTTDREPWPGFGALSARLIATASARPIAPAPVVDPATARRAWLGDRAQALLDGGFPPIVVDPLRSDALLATPALECARSFLAGSSTMLLLIGGTGTGKTTAGAWIAREAGGSRPGLVRSTALERAGRYDHAHADWLTARTLLVLDDLGVEYIDAKGAFLSLLDELIDKAYGHRRRLVITTNADEQTIADRVQERIWSRISEAATIVRCGDVDLRRAR